MSLAEPHPSVSQEEMAVSEPSSPLLGQGIPPLPPSIPTTVGLQIQDDSLDSSDVPFSQEILLSPSSLGSTAHSTTDGNELCSGELQSLCTPTAIAYALAESCDAGGVLCEDIESRLFVDFDDERHFHVP